MHSHVSSLAALALHPRALLQNLCLTYLYLLYLALENQG